MSNLLAERDAPVVAPPRPAGSGSTRRQGQVMVFVVVIPLLGVAAAIALLWGRAAGWVDLAILLGMYVPVSLGVTVGYHRMLTHRAFEAPAWVRATFLAFGSMSIEGGALEWAVDHRQHHAFSDKEGDPHSPHAGRAPGFRGALAGLWHAHMGWMFEQDRKRNIDRYGKDLKEDRVVMFMQRTFFLWAVLGFVLPGLIGLAVTRSWTGFLTGALWGGLVRVFLNHHVTWSINSICHFFGNRPFRSADLSTNNWLLALPSMGESWHHNHHVFPSSAVHGLTRRQIDISALVIGGLERVGLAWNVRRPSAEQLERKLEDPGAIAGRLRGR